MSGYTRGPWKFARGYFNSDADGLGSIHSGEHPDAHDARYIARVDDADEAEANASLIADAPAMALCLDLTANGLMLAWPHSGVARFRDKAPGPWTSYRFSSYTGLLDQIGWDHARAALKRRTHAA